MCIDRVEHSIRCGFARASIKRIHAVGRRAWLIRRAGVPRKHSPPFELAEITRQIFEVGWRSGPLIIVSGFASGVVLALQTRASMEKFGAAAMIPQAVSLGLFRDVGPLIAALLLSGRVGAGIGAELAGMRVTEQIDALESLAVNSFKYLVVTRVVACVLALPILTTLLNFSGLAGGLKCLRRICRCNCL